MLYSSYVRHTYNGRIEWVRTSSYASGSHTGRRFCLTINSNPNSYLKQLEEFYEQLMKNLSDIYSITCAEDNTFKEDFFYILLPMDE